MRIKNQTLLLGLITAMLCLGLVAMGCGEDEEDVGEENSSSQTEGDTSDDVEEDDGTFVEEDDDTTEDFNLTFDYSVLTTLGHPRLLMTEDDFTDLNAKLADPSTYPLLYQIHEEVISLADDVVSSSYTIDYDTDELEECRLAMKRLFSCAYAYRTTGEEKYLNKAISDLNNVCSWSDWHLDSSHLEAAEMCMGVALAYDWLYYDLPYATRVLAHSAMISNEIQHSYSSATFHNSEGNWNSVCCGGTVAAAITLYEKDKTKCVNAIESCAASNPLRVADIYSPHGSYSEGVSYWQFGTSYQVMLISFFEDCFGTDLGICDTEGFMETANYILYMTGVANHFTYSDGGTATMKGRMASWWFAARQNDPDLLLLEMRLIEEGNFRHDEEDRFLPAIPCFLKDMENADVSSISPPSSDYYYSTGGVPLCIIHTGWNFDDDDYYVGVKGGTPNTSHGHMDIGSFVYDSQGVRWSEDIPRQSYSVKSLISAAGGSFSNFSQTSLRWDLYRWNNLCHSTICFDTNDGSVTKAHDTDQLVSGYATIEEVYDSGDYGVKMDLSSVYADAVDSVYRTVKLVDVEDGKDLYIIDEITAKSSLDATMQWRMMTAATVGVGSDRELLVQDGKLLYLTASNDGDVEVTFTTWAAERPDTWDEQTWDADNSEYTVAGYTATIPAGTTVTFTTVLSSTGGGNGGSVGGSAGSLIEV